MPLLTRLTFTGHVEALLKSSDRQAGLEKSRVGGLALRFEGIEGDCHGGSLH